MPAPLSVGFETVPEPVRSSHTLTLTAQDNGSSLILRLGETLQVVHGGNESSRLGWKASRLQAPPLPDGRSLPLAGGPQQISLLE
jgi:hypothetical protein